MIYRHYVYIYIYIYIINNGLQIRNVIPLYYIYMDDVNHWYTVQGSITKKIQHLPGGWTLLNCVYIYMTWKEHWISSGQFLITIVMRFGGSQGCACQTKLYACLPEALCACPISVSIDVLSLIHVFVEMCAKCRPNIILPNDLWDQVNQQEPSFLGGRSSATPIQLD